MVDVSYGLGVASYGLRVVGYVLCIAYGVAVAGSDKQPRPEVPCLRIAEAGGARLVVSI